jgi:RsiW-degrading membrane proteinase PrsW (M82 family)
MIYVENVFICIVAPLLITMICTDKRGRSNLIFFIAGMATCLLSAYVNTFFARFYDASIIQATVELAPVIEETMKILPLLFFLLVYEPEQWEVRSAIIFVAAGFATFENTCYLIGNGTSQLWFLIMRGFGTGTMHIVCGAIVGYGILYVWKRPWLKVPGAFGLFCIAINFHAIYNLLLSMGGVVQMVGLVIPIFTVFFGVVINKLIWSKMTM